MQARIRLTRSFDERHHSYLGYNLRIDGTVEGETREFLVAVGKGAHAKFEFRVGDRVSGEAVPVADPRLETAELYKASKLKMVERHDSSEAPDPPPYVGLAPSLEVYRERGHRRLNAKTFSAKCLHCVWGCRMPVEMIIDHWNPSLRRFRFETFCYGPKNCPSYRAGPTRKVPGRKGMSWEEQDWIDEDATAHRSEGE